MVTVRTGQKTRTARRKRLLVCMAAGLMAMASLHARTYIFKRSKIGTRIGGLKFLRQYTSEHAHPVVCHDLLGLRPEAFRQLLKILVKTKALRNTPKITAEEKLGCFLYMARSGASCRLTAAIFGRSLGTVAKNFKQVVKALVSHKVYTMFVKAPGHGASTPDRIAQDSRIRALKHVLGAVDGVHVAARPPASMATAFRDRHANLTFNVLAACGFDLKFHYILAGWEGSAADSHVYSRARVTSWKIPQGRMYLADAGYPLCEPLLTPYRNTRYHLNEWGDGTESVKTPQELFNRRHAGLRSVIERSFGIMKARFKVLKVGSSFSLKVQAALFPALAVVHNFLLMYDPEDPSFEEEVPLDLAASPDPEDDEPVSGSISELERETATKIRDKLARKMWRRFES